jgi:hypothetical protein
MQKFGQDYRDEIGLGQSPVNHMSTTICQACVTACDTHDSFCQAIFYVYDADFVCDYLRSLVRAGFLLTRSTGRNSLPKRIWNEDPSCSISGRLCFRSAKFCWLANMATSRKGRTIVSCKADCIIYPTTLHQSVPTISLKDILMRQKSYRMIGSFAFLPASLRKDALIFGSLML